MRSIHSFGTSVIRPRIKSQRSLACAKPFIYILRCTYLFVFWDLFRRYFRDGDDALSKQLNFTVLDTKHTEGAWVNVRVSKGCREEMKVPLITPRKDTSSGDAKSSSSIFLSHPDAASVRRRQLADWFARQDPKHHVQADALFAQLERAGMAALSETARHLARGMPIYTVTVQ